jgi:hypothetical protein
LLSVRNTPVTRSFTCLRTIGSCFERATIFGGLIFGRLVSLVLNGGLKGYGPTILALYVIDAIGLAVTITP